MFLELTDEDGSKFIINARHISSITAGEESGSVIEFDDRTELDVKETYDQIKRMLGSVAVAG